MLFQLKKHFFLKKKKMHSYEITRVKEQLQFPRKPTNFVTRISRNFLQNPNQSGFILINNDNFIPIPDIPLQPLFNVEPEKDFYCPDPSSEYQTPNCIEKRPEERILTGDPSG